MQYNRIDCIKFWSAQHDSNIKQGVINIESAQILPTSDETL